MLQSRKTILLVTCLAIQLAAHATTHNIAPQAHINASSQMDDAHRAGNVADGIIRTAGHGEWRSAVRMAFWGEIDFPWIELSWDEPQEICSVTIYDIASGDATCSGGELVFDDGSRVLVRGIPATGAPRTVTFEPRMTRAMRFEITDGDGDNIGLSEIEVRTTPTDPVTWADPYIETTRGRYFYFATGSLPFGMISAAPLTRNKNQGGGGYNYNACEVLGFPQIHAWMLGGLNLMPITGTVDAGKGEQEWKSPFGHDGEVVQPAYHRLYLERYDTWVEQTCTRHASLYRLTYTRDAKAHLLLSLGGYVGTCTMVNAHITKRGDDTIAGYFDTTGRLWGGPETVRVFFAMQAGKPFDSLEPFGAMTGDWIAPTSAMPRNDGMSYADAPVAGVSASYDVKAADQVCLKIAVSYTSVANAEHNLTEIDGFDFDKTRQAGQAEWNQMMGRISVSGGTAADRTKLYTDLWHALLGRHQIDDLSGDYPDYTQGGTVEGKHTKGARLVARHLDRGKRQSPLHIYNSDALWLSQWNLNILWGLAWPEVLDDFAGSMLQMSLNGGLLPRGPCAGGYSWIMSGCPATSLITSAWQRGIRKRYSPKAALDAMVRNHGIGGMQAYGQDEDLEYYEQHGYVPDRAGLTIQWSFEDWALAEMAGKMGKARTAKRFYKRSHGWVNSFNPRHKLVMPRTKDGGWLHEDPLNGWGYEEANAWQATFGLSHDLPLLSSMMGGNDSLCAKLDYAFRQSQKDDFVSGYGNGYVSYANQPGLSNSHVFGHAGRPDLTQYWVRQVRRQAYGGTTPDKGYGGHDEDQGQMAALSALMSIGLFSIDGGSGSATQYDITSPIFDEITIQLSPDYAEGKTFRIIAHDNSDANCYIQRIELNGSPLDRCQVSHGDIWRGGTLEIWLGDKPGTYK